LIFEEFFFQEKPVLIKNNLFSFFRLTTIVITLLAALIFSELSFAGYSDQGDALSQALYEDLVKKRVCSNMPACSQMLQMYGSDGKRILLNMYAQKDTVLVSKVVAFLVEKGLKISRGMPITLKVFSAPKSKYLGLKSISSKNDEFLKLELNK
jgi:hypothetical protein